MREVTLHTDKPSSIIHSAPNPPRPRSHGGFSLGLRIWSEVLPFSKPLPSPLYSVIKITSDPVTKEHGLECHPGVRQTKNTSSRY